jgi:hypothetical protein
MKKPSILLSIPLLAMVNCNPLIAPIHYTTLADLENGQTVALHVNDSYGFKFTECAGCAYTWEINSYDPNFLHYVRKDYSNRNCTDCVGGIQEVTFIFKAVSTGNTGLRFNLATDTVDYHINIYGQD